ncbi:hypothetical protein VTK26DRAFT_2129 [Humicola hyalothermophila]
MSALPENWEWDYDGKRWFYRYKPTGLIQYTFPKPGDEFPEFIDESAPPLDLAPEEKLVSQQQIKRRSTLTESPSTRRAAATSREARSVSNASTVREHDDGGAPFWLQPDGLMYLGPGAYNDVSPLLEEEEEALGHQGAKADKKESVDQTAKAAETITETTTSTTATTVTTDSATADSAPPKIDEGAPSKAGRSTTSPAGSAETTPQVASSQPTTTTPNVDGAVMIESIESAPVETAEVEATEIPLVDSKEVPFNPVGIVAELVSESTAECHNELHPDPVELPSNEIMIDTSDPVVYANAFQLAPVELDSEEVPAERRAATNKTEPKASPPRAPEEDEEQQRAYRAVHELLNRPFEPARQNCIPSSASGPANRAAGKYCPYSPAARAGTGATALNRSSMAEFQEEAFSWANKRHSLAGPGVLQFRSSDVPAVLLPAHSLSKQPLDVSKTNGQRSSATGSRTQEGSISGCDSKAAPGGLSHVPSVLQPARGRPKRVQSPSHSQNASPSRDYQAYKPYQDLQRDIEDTVQLLSQISYNQNSTATMETSDPGRPQVSRTNTLPANLPSLPYMGVRPHLPHSSSTAPILRGNQQTQAPTHGHSDSVSSGGEASTAISHEYSAPLPSSSSDLPKPLNISRSVVASATLNNVSSSSTSCTIPITTEPVQIPWQNTATPSHTMTVSSPVTTGPIAEAMSISTIPNSDCSIGTGFKSASGQTVRSQSNPQASPKMEPAQVQEPRAAERSTLAKNEPSTPLEQPPAGTSNFIHVESPFSASSQLATSIRSSATAPESNNHRAVSSTLAVGAVNAPEMSHSMAGRSDTVQTSQGKPLPQANLSSAPLANAKDQSSGLPHQSFPTQGPLLKNPDLQISTATSSSSSVAANNSQIQGPTVISQTPTAQTPLQPSEPNPTLPTTQATQATPSQVAYASPASPATSRRQLSLGTASGGLHTQQAVASPPQPSISPRVPTPRSPSPVSRGSSPSIHRGSVSQSLATASRPVGTTLQPPAVQSELNQDSIQAQNSGRGTSLVSDPPPVPSKVPLQANPPVPSKIPLEADPQGPGYSFPAGHHPLAFHPVDISQSPTPEPSAPPKPGSSGPQDQIDPSAQVPAPVQSHVGDSRQGDLPIEKAPVTTHAPKPSTPAAQNANQGPPVSVPAPLLSHQQPALGPVPAVIQGQASGQVLMQSPLPTGPSPAPMQPGGHFPTAQQPPQTVQGTFSVAPPVQPTTQAGGPHHPGGSRAAPPQVTMMFAPPAMPQGTPPLGVQFGGPQQPYAIQPGAMSHPGMIQHQPAAPHMSRASHIPGGTQPMQAPQAAPLVVKEEKGWFGKLFRSGTVRQSSSASSAANKLQKQQGHVAGQDLQTQQQPVFLPPQNQPHLPLYVPAPQFQGAPPPALPPQMMMHTTQQHQPGAHQRQQQQYQQPHPPYQPPQFQQHQPLFWQNGVQPQIPNPNPGQPVLPPPHVRQLIQAQQLPHLQQQQLQLHQQQQQQQVSAGKHTPRGSVGSGSVAGNGNGNGGGGGGAAGKWTASSPGYDGSGWGDDESFASSLTKEQ